MIDQKEWEYLFEEFATKERVAEALRGIPKIPDYRTVVTFSVVDETGATTTYRVLVDLNSGKISYGFTGQQNFVAIPNREAKEVLAKLNILSLGLVAKLSCIDPYDFFLRASTPEWQKEYLAVLALSLIVQRDLERLKASPLKEDGHIFVPRWMIDHATALPESPHGKEKFLIRFLSYLVRFAKNKNEIEALMSVNGIALGFALYRLYVEGKIDEEFFNKAFNYLNKKDVIGKFLKGKGVQLPCNLGNLSGWNGYPKQLFSYIKTATWRFKQSLKCPPQEVPLDDSISHDQGDHDLRLDILRISALKDELPEKEREAISLIFWEELSQTEAARLLGITQPSFNERLKRALNTLKTLLS